ncbi:hypothetical protein M0811_10803 [Anaeramoeba ignava]|uniref:Uncharacterized protein n=1 Tax=Anaeramoeba ignava TaxID=1746090 RepID=A0A9Q0LDS2_ANAIG|nr:hypothetical protein M0811_10803 [Anaeramoeba ignava]
MQIQTLHLDDMLSILNSNRDTKTKQTNLNSLIIESQKTLARKINPTTKNKKSNQKEENEENELEDFLLNQLIEIQKEKIQKEKKILDLEKENLYTKNLLRTETQLRKRKLNKRSNSRLHENLHRLEWELNDCQNSYQKQQDKFTLFEKENEEISNLIQNTQNHLEKLSKKNDPKEKILVRLANKELEKNQGIHYIIRQKKKFQDLSESLDLKLSQSLEFKKSDDHSIKI